MRFFFARPDFPKRACVSRLGYALCALFSLVPLSVNAQVIITEIMYDLEGSDAGREWVEVHNASDAATDLSHWHFFENDTNHKLVAISGDGIVPALGYAVIADNADTFRADYPNYSGILFDSAFSLSNTGETIGLRDGDLSDIGMVSYAGEWGAAGDGTSLQKSGSVWVAAVPSPGTYAVSDAGSSTEGERGGGNETAETPAAEGGAGGGGTAASAGARDFPIEPQIVADAGRDRRVAVGADTTFQGSATGLAGKPLLNARFVWNFGDGETKEGRSVFHFYRYPGTYAAVLDVSSGEYAASDRVVVTARPADVTMTEASSERIVIENNDTQDLDLSWWLLKMSDAGGNAVFSIPKHTVIFANGTLILSSETTGLIKAARENTTLHYPNGVLAYAYEPEPAPYHLEDVVFEAVPATAAASPPPPLVPSHTATPEKTRTTPTLGAAAEPSQSPTSTHIAAPISAAHTNSKTTLITPWHLALLGLLALAVCAALALKHFRTDSDDSTPVG